jgi:hypothetical protein
MISNNIVDLDTLGEQLLGPLQELTLLMDKVSGVLSSVLSAEMKLNKQQRVPEYRIIESPHPCKSNIYDSNTWSISFPDAAFLTVHIDKRCRILSSSISFAGASPHQSESSA